MVGSGGIMCRNAGSSGEGVGDGEGEGVGSGVGEGEGVKVGKGEGVSGVGVVIS